MHEEEKAGPSVPLTATERKQKSRNKQKLMDEGSYQPTLLDEAKQELMAMESPKLEIILEMPKFKDQLSTADKARLQNFISNTKAKARRVDSVIAKREQQQMNIMEKAQKFTNQLIPDLHRALLIPQTDQERAKLIQEQIGDNLFLFLEYMENYEAPFPEFLRIIVELHPSLDEDTFTKLFARVCAQHRGEDIRVSLSMVQRAMEFLVESKTNSVAAFGLLRLVFQNSISLKAVALHILRNFEGVYFQTILNFFKSIAGMKSQVKDSLPPTLFVFTSPMLRTFKDGGNILHVQVPTLFLPFMIDIICHTFTESQESFDKFLGTFKAGCLKHYELLLAKQFTNLLQSISDETKFMSKLYFGDLNHITLVIERAFKLVQEKKIIIFDQLTVDALVKGNTEVFTIMSNRPSIVRSGAENGIHKALTELQAQNPSLVFSSGDIIEELSPQDQACFEEQGISQLMPLQHICMKLALKVFHSGRWFLQYETGQGKTALCLGIAMQRALMGHAVLVVNNSPELAFRDHKKAAQVSQQFKIPILRLVEGMSMQTLNGKIIYAQTNELVEFLTKNPVRDRNQKTLIIDEFDSLFFEGKIGFDHSIQLSQQFDDIIAFSGSKLQQHHKEFLESKFHAVLVDFFRRGSQETQAIKYQTQVFYKYQEFRDTLI